MWFRVYDLPGYELPPGCSVLLDNAAVMPISAFLDPEYPLDAADMLSARVIAFELCCPDCSGEGFH